MKKGLKIQAQFGEFGDIDIAEYREMAAERGLSSLFLGVCKDKGSFSGRISHNCTSIYIGWFSTSADAARAYDLFAKAIKPPTWVCNFSTDEDYGEFRKLEASGSAPKGLFDEVTKKAEFFKKALARGESASSALVAWKTQMAVQPGETWADVVQRFQALRDKLGKNPSLAWEVTLGLYRLFRLEHSREPKYVGSSLPVLERPLEYFLAKWVKDQKLRSNSDASSRCEYMPIAFIIQIRIIVLSISSLTEPHFLYHIVVLFAIQQ